MKFNLSMAVIIAIYMLMVPLAGAANAPVSLAPQLARYLPIAQAAWPQSPCTGHEDVHLGDWDAINATEAQLGVQIYGFSRPKECQAFIRPGISPYEFCVTLVHEFGHMAGVDHNHIRGDVMNGDGYAGYIPCVGPASLEEAQRAMPGYAIKFSSTIRHERVFVARRGHRRCPIAISIQENSVVVTKYPCRS